MRRLPLPLRLLSSRLRDLLRDRRGVSAVEFGMILPVLAVMYMGTVEVTSAVTANRKMVAAASAVGDLTAQATDINDTEMSNIMNAASAVMQPFSATPLRLRVTQVRVDDRGRATVGWSDGRGMSALGRGATFTGLPGGLATPNTSHIFAEVAYDYTSPLGKVIVGTLTMQDQFFLRPRIGDCVRRSGNCG
jgi:Flp pilus assembly protein TadG